MKRILIIIYLLVVIMMLLLCKTSQAQSITQHVKGSVFDIQTNEPLVGVTVMITDSNPLIGAITDLNGNFSMSRVSLGRHTIQINYMGYESVILPEVLVTSGREVVLNVGLRPSIIEMDGFVVTPEIIKNRPLNAMASVGSRSFSVEETRRYAGGLDDPARLVSAFAGVTVGNIQDNAIIVRGNSPKGVSWRVEGVEIPAPHHLAGGNVAGGGLVTIFSSQMLSNSDFHTSAFPAEFGNALAGVFDMNFRTGNVDTHEHTVQFGTVGFDVASEGPIFSGSNATYLFNYRYSTLGLLTDVQVIPTDQQIRYQDLSFKLSFPTSSIGTFSLWGVGGIDKALQPLETDPLAWDNDWDRVSFDWGIQVGAIGLSHTTIVGKNGYVTTTLAATGSKNRMQTSRQDDDLVPHPDLFSDDNTGTISLGSSINYSFSPRFTTKTGFTVKSLQYNLDISSTIDSQPDSYRNVVMSKGNSSYMDLYTQFRYQPGQNLTVTGGINVGYFALGNSVTVDPRIALTFDLTSDQSVSFGYGSHSQLEDLKIYMVRTTENGVVSMPNKTLGPSRAHHVVFAYNWQVDRNIRLKVEPYAQFLYDAPGVPMSSYSLINYKKDWAFSEVLENNSIGRNIGVDVTFERFLNKGYYYLLTGSIFSSRYKADDGIWRNTRFNKNFVVNVLFGKEFALRQNRKLLGINTRLNVVGGERVSPVLEDISRERQLVFFDESRAFENQLPTIFYADLSITYRVNRARYSGIFAFQIKNLFGQATAEGFNYSYKTQSVVIDNSVVVIPSISYTIEF